MLVVEKRVGVRDVMKSQCGPLKKKVTYEGTHVCIATEEGVRETWMNEIIALTPAFMTD